MVRRGSVAALALVWGLGAAAPAWAEGRLAFFASGEDLATEGFVDAQLTRDGWALTFDHIFVTVTALTAHQAEPPYDAMAGGEIQATTSVVLAGEHSFDLVEADADDRVLIGEVEAPVGHFNALSWRMTPATAGPAEGYAMVFVGTAERDGVVVPFVLRNAEARTYRCGEFVGDERKGFVVAGGMADLELTFHLDHVFGRADKAADDPTNLDALGFDAFAAGGEHEITLRGMHIGHAGEGHCDVVWE